VALFGRENVLILFSDDLKARTHEIVTRVLEFLALDPLPSGNYQPKHVREYTTDPAAKDKILKVAGDLFANDKRELREKFGLEVPW
jgi:hypothetical protein